MPGMGELLIILVIPAMLGIWIWMLVDCLTRERDPQQRLVWALVIGLTGIIGALIYMIVRRPKRPRA